MSSEGRRLAEVLGEWHTIGPHFVYTLNAERLAAASVEEIRALQFTTRKAEYIIGVAHAIADDKLNLATFAQLPCERVTASTRGLPPPL
ncbi:MAG TPA: hypothetical protein VKV40_23670 [Ktedonobacteraceae bacterium]|nr:hypothetical protein [Ktedonobacteraceae bacterium]